MSAAFIVYINPRFILISSSFYFFSAIDWIIINIKNLISRNDKYFGKKN